ncbi:hypothetical protein ABK040_011135 [Willaertia magna]
MSETNDIFINYPLAWMVEAVEINKRKGKGKIKSKRSKFIHNNVYANWNDNQDKFLSILHITKEEFDFILNGLERIDFHRFSILSMSLPNKLLLTLHFVIQYTGGNNLACLFNVSNYYVSKVLDEMLPYLVEYFTLFIPNKNINNTKSRLHCRLKYIIDGTLHKTQRKYGGMDLDYNGHYHIHGKMSQILLDYEGYIIAFLTKIKGKIYDSLSANYNKNFKRILGSDFALGDFGFNGVGYVISGFKPSTLST